MKARSVVPELLDSLPPDDPEAIRSRADLRLINGLMGNYRWFERVLSSCPTIGPGARIVELGAGDGTLARRLLARGPGLRYEAIDLAPAPPDLPSGCTWHQADLFEVLPQLSGEAVIANLFLHHFQDEQLRQIGRMLRHVPVLAFSEPCRHPRFHWGGHALALLGINRVTRHDLHVSIDAGFAGQELAQVLETGEAEIHRSALGAYRLLKRP